MSGTRIALSLIAALVLAGWQSHRATQFDFTEGGGMWIDGTSTVHDWTCDVQSYNGSFEAEVDNTVTSITSGKISIAAESIECHKGTMNRKALEAIDSKAHPTISFEMARSTVVPGESGAFQAETTGKLSIAGVTRDVAVSLTGTLDPQGRISLKGDVPISLADYEVDPPTAMLGVLKTGNEVTIRFELLASRSADNM